MNTRRKLIFLCGILGIFVIFAISFFVKFPSRIQKRFDGVLYTVGGDCQKKVTVELDGICLKSLLSNENVYVGRIKVSSWYGTYYMSTQVISLSRNRICGVATYGNSNYTLTSDDKMKKLILMNYASFELHDGDMVVCAPAKNREEAQQIIEDYTVKRDKTYYLPAMQELFNMRE